MHFVSLDTHPANSALVVTYEVLVSVLDRTNKRELMRRSKRNRMLINIQALDNLGEDELRQSDKLILNLQELSEQIGRKCPLLLSDKQNIEDIQLNLLYLVNRRQSQLISNNNRPPSSASLRLKSGQSLDQQTSGGGAAANKLRHSGRQRLVLSGSRESLKELSSSGDVYSYLRAKELSANQSNYLETFMNQFEHHLSEQEQLFDLSNVQTNHQHDFDAQLEGLYGDNKERHTSIVIIRHLSRDDRNLLAMSSNRLLICAIVRTLRDSDTNDDGLLKESIFYCLIRLTTFDDVYANVFNNENDISLDLLRVVIDLFDEHVKLLLTNHHQAGDVKFLAQKFYYTNSLLIILLNLFNLKLDSIIHNKQLINIKQKLIQQHLSPFIQSVNGLFLLISKYLSKDIRQYSASNKQEKLSSTLSRLITIVWHLSIYKDFINQLRIKSSQPLIESIIKILNILQLSRPGSGASSQQEHQLIIIKDPSILNEIYELEINILKLVVNLLFDNRLRARMIKKNLTLKCILRNLVVFLASRKSNTLSPFNKSSVLIIPFKCLYELTCCDSVKQELYKSKIIIKCLLEYLLSSSSDLKSSLDMLTISKNNDPIFNHTRPLSMSTNYIDDQEQIILVPDDASHYIVSLWINLSARKSASFYTPSDSLHEPLSEYIELAIDNLSIFITLALSGRRSISLHRYREAYLMVFIHMKLVRNLTQFLDLTQDPLLWADSYLKWTNKMSETTNELFSNGEIVELNQLSVECLAILSNLIASSKTFGDLNVLPDSKSSSSLLTKLLQVNFADLNSENDDLLLVSINFIGILAQNREICSEININHLKIIKAINFILDSKITDTEMTVSCLYTLVQLMNHSSFLKEAFLSDDKNKQQIIEKLVDRLSSLIMHNDITLAKLTDSILNTVKQLEEQQSLSDSITCEKRFAYYNSKWLNAIRAHRDDSTGDDDSEHLDVESNYVTKIENRNIEEDELELNVDEFNQLRAFDDEVVSISSGRSVTTIEPNNKLNNSGDDDDNYGDNIVEDEDDDDASFGVEPDLNVIDANSMIRHLTSRKEFRSEWLQR